MQDSSPAPGYSKTTGDGDRKERAMGHTTPTQAILTNMEITIVKVTGWIQFCANTQKGMIIQPGPVFRNPK